MRSINVAGTLCEFFIYAWCEGGSNRKAFISRSNYDLNSADHSLLHIILKEEKTKQQVPSWDFILYGYTNFTFCNMCIHKVCALSWGMVTHYIPYRTCSDAFNLILCYVSLQTMVWHFITSKVVAQPSAHPTNTKCVGTQLLVLRHFSGKITQKVHILKAFLENVKHMRSTYASNKHPLALCPQFQSSHKCR